MRPGPFTTTGPANLKKRKNITEREQRARLDAAAPLTFSQEALALGSIIREQDFDSIILTYAAALTPSPVSSKDSAPAAVTACLGSRGLRVDSVKAATTSIPSTAEARAPPVDEPMSSSNNFLAAASVPASEADSDDSDEQKEEEDTLEGNDDEFEEDDDDQQSDDSDADVDLMAASIAANQITVNLVNVKGTMVVAGEAHFINLDKGTPKV